MSYRRAAVLFRCLLWDVAQRVGQRVGRWPDPATLTVTTLLHATGNAGLKLAALLR